MPISKLRATPRAKALIASVVAVAVGGCVTIFPGQPKVHDDTALAIKTPMPWEPPTRRLSRSQRKAACLGDLRW